ncbi:MAG: hypothetical protein RLN96_02920, partial [Pseudomonadales bacterium]
MTDAEDDPKSAEVQRKLLEPSSLAETLLFSTLRLECHYKDGTRGTGTGFVYGDKLPDDRYCAMLVTNKHVFDHAHTIETEVHLGDALVSEYPNGKTTKLQLNMAEVPCVPHPDPAVDLCAIPFRYLQHQAENEGHYVFYKSLAPWIIPTDEQLKNLDAINTVVMIGYPNGLWDPYNNLPI